MKNILIISDSHGLTREMDQIKKRHEPDVIFHCGDSELESNHSSIQGMHIVKGNCDFGADMPEEKEVTVQGIRFLLTHGHLYQVGRDLTTLSYLASQRNAQVVCYGHTHMAGAVLENGQVFINPGSIYTSRDRRERTYAMMQVSEEDKNIHVTFFATDGRKLEELDFQHQFN